MTKIVIQGFEFKQKNIVRITNIQSTYNFRTNFQFLVSNLLIIIG